MTGTNPSKHGASSSLRVVMLLANPFNPDERVLREARALGGAGYQVTILAWDREGRFPVREEGDGYRVERIRLQSGYGIRAVLTIPLFNLLLFVRLLRVPAAIIHCHDFDTLVPGFLVGKLRSIPLIYDAHEYYAGMIRGIRRGWGMRLIASGIDWLEAILVRRVAAVITVVPFLEKRYRILGAKRVVIVWNAKDINKLTHRSPAVRALRQHLGLTGRPFVYLYVGLFDRRRAPWLQIEAFRSEPKLAPAMFLLMGFARDLSVAELTAAIGDAPNIRLLPGVPAPELPPYVALADVIDAIHDPRDDNFRIAYPNKFFEAVAAGKPLVTTEGLAIGDLIKDQAAGLVLPYHDREAFTAGLLHLKDDPSLYRRLARNARRLGETEYHWTKAQTTLLNLYASLTG
ncbi:glycosyltransferase family 4 protein [Candidatus Berkelbacteria bacterium]|nr:glycosyltransferase family 4 protein [Candidatus Berkelbacteria bacterium]